MNSPFCRFVVGKSPHQPPTEVLQRLKMAYCRGDSMISDFTARRPLPVRDNVVSIEGGP